jgi:hypothetical protein
VHRQTTELRRSRGVATTQKPSVLAGVSLGTDQPCFTRPMIIEPTSGWFAVRCLFRKSRVPTTDPGGHGYEERITLWRASNIDEAIAKAETEALDYASIIKEAPDEYLGLAQAYALGDSPDQEGAEVFSLIRDSTLDPERYLDAFFDTGQEHQRSTPPSDSASAQVSR